MCFLIEQKQIILHITVGESLNILLKITDGLHHSGTVRGTEVSSSGNVLLKSVCHWMPSGPSQNRSRCIFRGIYSQFFLRTQLLTEWDNMQEGRNVWKAQIIARYLSSNVTSCSSLGYTTLKYSLFENWSPVAKKAMSSQCLLTQAKFNFSCKTRQELAR